MARKISFASLRRVLVAPACIGLLALGASAQKVTLTAILDGAQEVPPNASAGKGTAYVIVDRAANTLTYALCFDGMGTAENAAHIHGFSPPGAASGVLFALPLGKFKSGVLAYAEAQEANILNGLTYLNIHSVGIGAGELRGQLVRSEAPFTLTAIADGAQEIPPNGLAGKGVGWFKFNIVANTFDYAFTRALLGSAENSAHIHGFSAPGAGSGVLINLPLGFHKTGTFAYGAAQEANYLAGLAYVNIHTVALAGGEIRGQIVPTSSNPTTYCAAKLNTAGCFANVSFSGAPTLAAPDDFHVLCSNAINNMSGIMFWSALGTNNAPFFGGTMCVKSPVIRTAVMNSGGSPTGVDCTGSYDFAFTDAYMAANGLSLSSGVYCEFWYRDPADPFTVSTSNALYAEIY